MVETARSEPRYVVEECTDRDEWDSFLERNDGPAYALWGWSDAVASYGHDRWNLVVRDRDSGSIAGALPLYHVDSRLFGSQLLSPAFAERGSITLGDGDREAARRLLLERTRDVADTLGVDHATLRGSDVAGTDGFSKENSYVTFQVSTDRGPDAVWKDVKDSRLRQIEQADGDSSLQFRTGDSIADLEEYYRLYLESMRGHGSPPHSFDFFRILWDRLYDEGNLRLSMITRDGSLINGMIDLALGSTVYQWGVITDYEHRDLNGGSLLLWKSLEWAAENGYDTYEFGRTREGSGVYMFKKSFGGSKEWYDDLHYFPGDVAELPDPEDDKYEFAQDVWRRLPISVTRLIGPQIRKRIGL
ncbi:GNAT family N-acetyltransferase [Halostella sp. JP-L12]|uniref:GNAT family N-acetyltransferase n=1 Tax=Halostella TaxID=1843185 RepID=UPI000EF84D9C|nr:MULTISPECIES: GNAT family N-acetyltransferase [Halostella]NHN46676.1 GNAT family N-acetyltransferase [Halostella sp. JP-L12]